MEEQNCVDREGAVLGQIRSAVTYHLSYTKTASQDGGIRVIPGDDTVALSNWGHAGTNSALFWEEIYTV